MKKYKLGDCLSMIKNGAIIKQAKGAKGYPITRIETLSNNFFNRDKLGYADIFDITPYKDYILESGDLIMSHINSRQFLGRTVLYNKLKDEIIIHGMNVLRIKTCPELLDPIYAYYLFKTEYFRKNIDNIRKDAINQSSISISDINNIILELPVISLQKSTVSILSSIDRKIELNRSINHNLEAMAKQLYDYWFLQFDFPDENGKPYKSSGGKMVWNEKLKREIPEGWELTKVVDIAKVFNGATPSTTREQNYGGDIIWITPKDLSDQKQKFVCRGERNISQIGYDSCSTHLLPVNTILMSSRAPIGLLAIAKTELCTNQGFKNFVLQKENMTNYLYYYLQIHIKQIEQLGTGTTFKEVSREDILKYLILKPNETILYLWEEKIKALNHRQFKLQEEIQQLIKLRDELLPLLMNGQIEIGVERSRQNCD